MGELRKTSSKSEFIGQTNLLWTGREYYSLENCVVNVRPGGASITSTIVGLYDEKIYQVDYRIQTSQNWETLSLEIKYRQSNKMQVIRLEGDGKGSWMKNGEQADEFKGCIDVDISLTPFTNTLPISRLPMRQHDSQDIHVLYCDLLAGELRPVFQKYTRLSETEYRYQNIPNDFGATIEVDEAGFVVDYPQLFVRTAAFTFPSE
ncbi:putative glycolipid-binding domain-containing protein [Arcticibacter sp. MXS-1]|uniref:putative glycolipid-binding domain-containing protein n=1 Tax=Arcticibacter sp. MXS-1 TaxID=3341726 RepID=UPI0035A953E4